MVTVEVLEDTVLVFEAAELSAFRRGGSSVGDSCESADSRMREERTRKAASEDGGGEHFC